MNKLEAKHITMIVGLVLATVSGFWNENIPYTILAFLLIVEISNGISKI